jgi:hypothetical protein
MEAGGGGKVCRRRAVAATDDEQEVASCLLDLEKTTELPLAPFCKLLSNFLKKLKTPKTKVAQKFKIYNFLNKTFFKFILDFEI